MQKKLNFVLISTLILLAVSCKNEKKNNNQNFETETKLKTDSTKVYDELANTQKGKIITISEYNSDNKNIENIERPEKTIIRNLEIDTTKAFGVWTRFPNDPVAEFRLDSESFFVADYDGNGAMPYILNKNELTIFYNDFIKRGVITSTKNNTLKIKWSDFDKETEYQKFENNVKKEEKKPFVIFINTEKIYLNNFNITNRFDEEIMVQTLGSPDKLEKNIDNLEETGFPDYFIDYGNNTIWASYGYISDVFIKSTNMKINDIKIGDNRNKIEKTFNIKTKLRKYIQLVNPSEESIFVKFDENNIITELNYSKLIL